MTWIDVSQWLGGGAFFLLAVLFGSASANIADPFARVFSKANICSLGFTLLGASSAVIGGFLWRAA